MARLFGQTQRDIQAFAASFNGKVAKSALDRAQRSALNAYKKQRLPLKFKGRRYNPTYTKNTQEYEKRKNKTHPGKPQLVREGNARRMVLATARVRRQGNGYALKYKAPGYMGRRPREQIALGRNWNRYNSRDIRFLRRHMNRKVKSIMRRSRKRF